LTSENKKEVAIMAKKKDSMVFTITGIFVLAMLITPNFAFSQEPGLPKFITISSYPIGSLGTILATGFSNAIEKKTGIRTRPTPADTDVGRLLPIKKGEAQVGIVTAATVYFASEGLEEFSAKAFAEELAPHKINVNSIAPGYFATPLAMDRLNDPDVRNKIMFFTPLKTIGGARDIIGATILLASNASDFITGQTIYVDGGRTIL